MRAPPLPPLRPGGVRPLQPAARRAAPVRYRRARARLRRLLLQAVRRDGEPGGALGVPEGAAGWGSREGRRTGRERECPGPSCEAGSCRG